MLLAPQRGSLLSWECQSCHKRFSSKGQLLAPAAGATTNPQLLEDRLADLESGEVKLSAEAVGTLCSLAARRYGPLHGLVYRLLILEAGGAAELVPWRVSSFSELFGGTGLSCLCGSSGRFVKRRYPASGAWRVGSQGLCNWPSELLAACTL